MQHLRILQIPERVSPCISKCNVCRDKAARRRQLPASTWKPAVGTFQYVLDDGCLQPRHNLLSIQPMTVRSQPVVESLDLPLLPSQPVVECLVGPSQPVVPSAFHRGGVSTTAVGTATASIDNGDGHCEQQHPRHDIIMLDMLDMNCNVRFRGSPPGDSGGMRG